ncbi:unnamed protein product, partial [Meganyctiphanes norvegica]
MRHWQESKLGADNNKSFENSMDEHELYVAVFLAVCIISAVVLRYICVRHCQHNCCVKKQRHIPDRDDTINLPNNIMPIYQHNGGPYTTSFRDSNNNLGRRTSAVFITSTFLQQDSSTIPHL